MVKIIRQEVNRLSGHIDRVLELASLESRKKVFTMVQIDFRPCLEKLCEDFHTLVSMEEVTFNYELQPGEYTIKTEVFHLENAINNLLDNAKKYSDEPVISLHARLNEKHLTIEITDNGKGIDERDQKRIFRKYFRVTDGDLHKVKGYGLGLSYVKKVIESMKGKIRIQSKKNSGTRVTVQIPLSHAG